MHIYVSKLPFLGPVWNAETKIEVGKKTHEYDVVYVKKPHESESEECLNFAVWIIGRKRATKMCVPRSFISCKMHMAC